MEDSAPRPTRLHKPRIIPVMDIRGGVVVRAIAGRREEYKPLVSRLTNSTDPLVVANALRQAAGTQELYVADLDAIMGAKPNLGLHQQLAMEGFKLWVDAGIRHDTDASPVVEAGAAVVIAALESLHSVLDLRAMIGRFGQKRVAYSLDLYHGAPILGTPYFAPDELADVVASNGLWRLIILDLANIGVGAGTGTIELCSRTKAKNPNFELIAGGGVRGPADLPGLAEAGVDAVLVASALHDGKFGLPSAAL